MRFLSSFISRRGQLYSQWKHGKYFGTKRYNITTEQDNPNLIPLRHTTAHIMAMAVQSLYPEVKVTIGPWIQHGYHLFFYLLTSP